MATLLWALAASTAALKSARSSARAHPMSKIEVRHAIQAALNGMECSSNFDARPYISANIGGPVGTDETNLAAWFMRADHDRKTESPDGSGIFCGAARITRSCRTAHIDGRRAL